jgi:hypothetical protein
MRVLNKIVIILILLVIMILIPMILIFPEQAEFALRYAADVIQVNLEWLYGLSPTAQIAMRLLLALGGLIVFLIGLLLIVLELFRSRRKTVRLKDKSGELMVDSIAGHLIYHLDLLPDVLGVRPMVSSKGKSLSTTIYIETPPDVNVPQKSAEVKETARKVIEDQLGLQTKGEIKVIVRPVAYPKISPVEQKRPTRADRPITPQLPPVEPMIEEEEKRAEPLYPEKQDIPYPTGGAVAPSEEDEPEPQQAPQVKRTLWDDVPSEEDVSPEKVFSLGEDVSPEEDAIFSSQDQEAQDDEDKDTTTFDAKEPPSEPFR